MQEAQVNYTTFIEECRTAMADGYSDAATTGHLKDRGDVSVATGSRGRTPKYLRIPWQHVQALAQAQVSLSAVFIYLLLWRQHAIQRRRTVSLTTTMLTPFGFTRRQKAWALDSLERAKLIRVQRHRGKNPLVTFCEEDAPWIR